ncbi:MAG: hypothetical protein MJ066_05835 [Clostridia bacterium]|nr:hypothetical protein [Clostridia bacterium]
MTIKIKLWKMTVNNIGWSNPATLYFTSREKAETETNKFPARDKITYAGQFNLENALEICKPQNTMTYSELLKIKGQKQ